jgi:uncharacterized protein YndB with AHSA1/START domain/catechol 2,3-dioxygenase-like lactoylglutathione lyase family enzyme
MSPRPPTAVTDGETVLATADLPANPETVFRATNTKEVEKWWGSPDTYWMTEWTSTPYAGGSWHVEVLNSDGSKHPAGGDFLEVDEPYSVIFTRCYEWDFPELGRRKTVVTYSYGEIECGTRITVRHDGFRGLMAVAAQHAEGWERVLGWLRKYLSEVRTPTRLGSEGQNTRKGEEMAKVVFGNHSAVRVPRDQRDKIRDFYCGVLGATIMRAQDLKDDIRLGDNFYIAFMYGEHANESEFLRSGKSVWLEIKSDNVEETRKRIVEFGVRQLDIPDHHLYFQAPGGQVLRLVGTDEDLSQYEGRGEGPNIESVTAAIAREA